jgi:uncharacterized protein (UPF0548 family)
MAAKQVRRPGGCYQPPSRNARSERCDRRRDAGRDDGARVGFCYRALSGHPVAGEEAFIVHREGDDVVLTVRSVTRPAADQPWRALFPVLRIAQRIAQRRYLRALADA